MTTTTAPNPPHEFGIGQRVRTATGGEMTITGVTADGQFVGQSGLEWSAADLRPIADETALTFQVDVSRTYRNKDGYGESGLKLNNSFKTETHTVESFIETVVKQGWPYTMVHAKRPPQETGAAARGVLTPKHTENFTSSQLLTFDDDSKTPGVVDFWTNEPFFGRYGLAFVESVNSEPGKAEKGHPTLLLDRPIADPALYRECLKAYCYAFPRLDPLTNVDRTIYNAQGARVHMVGAVCPFEEFERTYLEPYRAAEREKSAAIEAERERRRQETERAKAEGRTVSSSHEEAYLAGFLRWRLDHVAAKRPGDNRNKATYWAGRCIAGVEATEWARPHLHLLADVETRIINAAAANGYLTDHAHDDDREVLRVFDRGRQAGGEPLDPPTPKPLAGVNGRGRPPAPTPPPSAGGVLATAPTDSKYGEAANGSGPAAGVNGTVATAAGQPAAAPGGNGANSAEVGASSPAAFKPDDTGNAERFVAQHGENVRYDHSAGSWLVWVGTHWRRDNDGAAQRLAKATARAIYDEAATAARSGDDTQAAFLAKWAHTSAAESRRNAMLNLARTEQAIAITQAQLNRHNLLLNVQNGTLDLETCELRAHDRSDLLTYVLPVDYDPTAVCPTWDAFIQRVTGGNNDLADFLARAVGYTLNGEAMEECLFFLYGRGANGKSTFIETIMTLMGDLGHKARAQAIMASKGERIPNEVAALAGKRLVVTSEVAEGVRLDEGLVKDLTGRDTISARFLHRESFNFKPTFRLWMYGNHKPVIVGTDDGIWRRVKLIPFIVQIPEQERDPALPTRLRAELPGILAWAVRGWQDYQQRGLAAPTTVKDATAEYREESDTLGLFLSERCIKGAGMVARSGELHAEFSEWAATNHVWPMSGIKFSKALKERGLTKGDDNKGAYWQGIGILPSRGGMEH